MPGSGDGSQRCPDASEEEEEEEEEVEEEEVERCPICLGFLPGAGLAMPDSCTHLFCLECLLTWAESQTVPSCPVDRQPFRNVYMWDHPQGCVQVPVRKRASQPESERCLCGSPEPSLCLKSKQGRRVRRPSAESDGKTKGLVRKCSDEDPSAMNRKKVRGTRCPVWAPTQLAPIQGSLSQDLTQPLWVTSELARGPEGGQCKRQLQDCPWLGSAALIPAAGPTRQRFPASNWDQCPFQSSPVTFDFSSAPSFGPGHFVFQGRVCAVTCPKGGDKRGGRASGSKAPPKQAAPSRRSGRNSRAQEEAPMSDPGSSPPSPPRPADSDSSSSGAPAPPGRMAQGPGKRKGRKAPNRKAGKKGKGPAKGKAPVLSTPSASEEEQEDEGGNQEEEEKEGDADVSPPPGPAVHSESEHSDAEGSPEMRPLSSPGSPALPSHDVKTPGEREEEASPPGEKHDDEPEETEREEEASPPGEKQEDEPEEREDNEEEESQPLPASSPPHSPDVFSREDQKEEEEEEVPVYSPASEGAEDSQGGRNARLPSGSHSGSPGSPPSPGSDSDGQDPTAAEVKRGTPTDQGLKEERARDPSPAGDSAPETAGPEGGASGEKSPEDGPSDDDTNVVPMDCSSPSSQPANDTPAQPVSAGPKKRSASPGGADAAASPAHSDAAPRAGEQEKERERSQERKNGRQRRTRFHSPTSTWSPKREGRQDSSSRRSRSPAVDGSPPSRRSSRPRSRDRDRERDQPRRDRSRERKRRRSRTRSRSRSKSRSRSRSRSRTRAHRRGSSPDRPASRERSPQRGGRGGAGWRGGRGGDSWRSQGGGGNSENGSAADASPERPFRSSNPDWVAEQRGAAAGAAPWGGDSGWRGASDSGRGGGGGGGQGGCNRSFSGQQGETADGRWGRKNFPGAGNGAGGDAYSRFNENRGGGSRRKDMDSGDSMLDRSGWSSASSWAVRRTLPADVQDYYSRRDRGGGGGGGAGGGGWNRTDEEQSAAADPLKSDPVPQAGVPGNAPGGNPPLLPLPLPHPPQMGLLHNPYTAPGQRGAPPVSLQPAAPYAMPPQVPVHMHSAVPLFQAPGVHGLPPPPPPPPPMHHASLTAAATQPDGHTAQMSGGPLSYGNPPTVTQTKVGGPPTVQSHPLPTSTTQPSQHPKARADSSQKEKKQQIQERAVNEVKNAIKPYYQKKEITKDEYKEIVRKAVEKVCHSRSGEVNSSKVANLVKAYVDKYKHARKK